MDSTKQAFVKLQDHDSLADNGRYLFAILNAFSLANYRVYLATSVLRLLKNRYGPNESDFPPPARLALKLPNVTIVESPQVGMKGDTYVFDIEDKNLRKQRWHKRVNIKYDLFSRYLFSKPLIMPYSVHPYSGINDYLQRVKRLRNTPRNISILFSGDSNGYRRNWIHCPETIMSRMEILESLRAWESKKIVFIEERSDIEAVFCDDFIGKFVIASNEARVSPNDWLNLISKTSFFLCAPGIVMPMCHNAIEAMAVGTIPITNYPEWFSPRLEHLKNCITFRSETELISAIELVLKMSEDEILEMKQTVIQYFETHLSPISFMRRLENRNDKKVTVLMHSERYVAKHSKKLHAACILLKGEQSAGKYEPIKTLLPKALR